MIEKIDIKAFLELAKKHVVLDVRSPGEYVQAHIPGAYSLPLFSDEERKIVGTSYKQEGREHAIKIGLDFFGLKMRKMVEEVEVFTKSKFQIPNFIAQTVEEEVQIPNSNQQIPVLVHCWRGGMRSAGVAWLLDLYGFKVYVLNGGYKAFRNWVLQQFDIAYPFKVLGGYTGSGKTEVLKALAENGHSIIDLECIAHHKGSAFGALGEEKQPRQEMFENKLAVALHDIYKEMPHDSHIWIEDESRRIGNVNIPGALWDTMRRASLYFLDIPFEERLGYITQQYGKFSNEELADSITRIQKRLGGQAAKDALSFLQKGDKRECFRILLCYYDKFYAKDISNRGKLYLLPQSNNKLVQSAARTLWNISVLRTQPSALFKPILEMKRIVCDTVDAPENSKKLV